MRPQFFSVVLAAGALHLNTLAQPLEPAVLQLQVRANPEAADLACQAKLPATKITPSTNPDPLEVPSEDMVRTMAAQPELQPGGQQTPQTAPDRSARQL